MRNRQQQKLTSMNTHATGETALLKPAATLAAPCKVDDEAEELASCPKPGIDALSPSFLPIGFIFGYALQAGGVAAPEVIVHQFDASSWRMMTMFLAAVSSALAWLALMNAAASSKRGSRRLRYVRKLALGGTGGLLAATIGGGMLGSGMAISGSCPGTVFAQMGAGVPNSGFVLLGGLAAALPFALAYKPFFDGVQQTATLSGAARTLDGLLSSSYTLVAACVSAALAAAAVAVYAYAPHAGPLVPMAAADWPGWMAGVVVGALQLPAVLAVPSMLGASSSYLILLAWLLSPFVNLDEPRWAYLRKFRHAKPKLMWQGALCAAAMAGGFVAALAGSGLGSAQGVSVLRALLGGFMIVMGARIAGGCTSGHGISGIAQLRTISLVTVAALMAGGFATGFTLQAAGLN
eukprot:PLAT11647.5.p1 GENE.PLAT11647.5~~PLAT11647.5.p1  ORF type:complete len:407 (-),score=191.59 PLAT11647.5:742-1962(-)